MSRIRDLECGIRRAKNEIEVWKSRFKDLETQFLRIKQVELYELEKALGVLKTNYDRLSSKFEDKKIECDGIQSELDDMILQKICVQNELKEYKRSTTKLNEHNRKVMFVSEKRAQERIGYLEEEIKKMESSETNKYVELEKENRELECGIRRAKDEIEVLKKKVRELECGKRRAEDETEVLNKKVRELECGKRRAEDEIEVLKKKVRELECGKKRAEDEIEVLKKKVRELETQEASWLDRVVELEIELDMYKTKCKGLSLELEEKKTASVEIEDKLKDLMLRKIAIDDELKECKTMCNVQKEKITLLEEDNNILCENEKRAQEQVTLLSNEFKKRESDDSEMIDQLTMEIKNLETGKRNVENEVDVWKKRFSELDAQVLRLNQVELKKSELEKELEDYKTQCHRLIVELEGKKMEVFGVESKLKDLEIRKNVVDDELKLYKTRYNGMKELIISLEEEQKDICEYSKKAQERIACLEEEIRKMEVHCTTDGARVKTWSDSSFAGCYNPSSFQGIKHVEQIAGPLSINMQSEPLVNTMEETMDTLLESSSNFGSGVKKQLHFELERSSSDMLDVLEEEESAPKHTCNIKGKQSSKQKAHVSADDTLKRSSDNKKNFASKKCLKRPYSDRRAEENGSSYEEDLSWSPIPKRRRSSKRNEIESDEDRIPIGKLKRKKHEGLNEGVHKLSSLNLCDRGVTRSSGDQNVEKDISPSDWRLISLKQCEEKKNCTDKTYSNESTSPNYLQMSEISFPKAAGRPTSKSGKEDVVENVGLPTLPSEGGITVNWSGSLEREGNSSDLEDARDIDLLLSQIIEMVQRNRSKESNWKSEADLLSSLDEDSELCMKAVCALYRQRISKKQLVMGFNKHDELRVTTLAKLLMDGDLEGDLKKSVKELESFPKVPEECKRLAKRYSKLLFTIYQNKEDPFFLPNSTGTSN